MAEDLTQRIAALQKQATELETGAAWLSGSYHAVATTITEVRLLVERLRETQQELLESKKQAELRESWLRSLVATTQDAVVSIDRQGFIVLFNPAAERIFGYSIEEVRGQRVKILMPEPYAREHDSYIEQYEKTGEAHAIGRIRNVEARRKNGDVFPIELSVTEVEKDDQVHYAAFVRDVSERTRLQERLVESERLETAGMMASGMAHEIGNPLNGMYMVVQLLERKLAKEETMDNSILASVSSIKDEIRRLTALLDDFRSLARNEKYNFKSTCLATVCCEITSIQERAHEEAEIRVESTFDKNLFDVSADKDKLKQALLNICKNAMEAMPQGGTLSLRGYPLEDHAILEIADTGIGIQPGIDIFASFVTTKAKGTGLGLMLTRKIVSDHGGTISYTSEPGQGTVFRIALPLERTSL